MPRSVRLVAATASLLLAASGACADVVISSDTTQNMTCAAGVCAPTASDAVLNIGDLEYLLDSGSVTVTTTGAGVQAGNIELTTEFDLSTGFGLTLDAYQSITFRAQVADSGSGGVSLVTNDGGSGGVLSFMNGGSLTLGTLSHSLSINGVRYQLERDIKSLAYDIGRHPNGAFALVNDFDAKKHGIYSTQPIPIAFTGTFNGLGHVISRLEIIDNADDYVGLFYQLASPGMISSIGLESIVIRSTSGYGAYTGSVVGYQSGGTIFNSWSSGTVDGGYDTATGGLVGLLAEGGSVANSWSSAKVINRNELGVGGLVGELDSGGAISGSFATGHVSDYECVGGLVGAMEGTAGPISNSYATGSLSSDDSQYADTGGFVGCATAGTITSSYSTGSVAKAIAAHVGGFIGDDIGAQISDCYWDKNTSGTDTGSGTGNDQGIKGLTSRKLRSGLPKGFDPSIWAENPSINKGFTYLIANPPPE